MRHLSLLIAVPATVLLSACHRWVPVETAPAVGTTVEATLTETGTAELTPVVGPRVHVLQGEFVSGVADTFRLALREIRTRDGQSLFLHGTTMDLYRPLTSQLRMQQFDRRRTVVAVVVGVVGAGALIQIVRLGGLAGGSTDGGGGTPALRGTPMPGR